MRQRKWRIVGGRISLSVLVCGLVCAACMMSDPLSRFLDYRTQARLDYANRLDHIVGTIEPVFLAEDKWNFPNLSPDGRWMFMTKAIRDDGSRERALMDMETYRIYNIDDVPGGGGSWHWLDDHYFRMGQSIIKVPELQYRRLEQLTDWEDDPLVLKQLDGVNQVLAVAGQFPASYVLISTDINYPYIVSVEAEDETELRRMLNDIAYTIVPENIWRVGVGLDSPRVYSPDGNYFVSGGTYSEEEDTYYPQPLDGKFQKLVCCPTGIIFDAQTEKMVAIADKEAWFAKVLGWASDSSGVYLQFSPLGAGFSPAPAGFPTYKLLVPGQQPSGKVPILVDAPPPEN